MKSNGALNQVGVHFRSKLNPLANCQRNPVDRESLILVTRWCLVWWLVAFCVSASSFLTSTLHVEMTGYVRVDIRRRTTWWPQVARDITASYHVKGFVYLYLLNVCRASAPSGPNLSHTCSLIFHTATTTKGKRTTIPIADISRSRVGQQIDTMKALPDLFLGGSAPCIHHFREYRHYFCLRIFPDLVYSPEKMAMFLSPLKPSG